MNGKAIQIVCGGADGTAMASVSEVDDERVIEIRHESGSLHETRAAPEGELWRQAAGLLVSLPDELRLDPEIALEHIQVDHPVRWQADLLALAWCRTHWAKELLDCYDEELESLAEAYPRFRKAAGDTEQGATLFEVLSDLASRYAELNEGEKPGFGDLPNPGGLDVEPELLEDADKGLREEERRQKAEIHLYCEGGVVGGGWTADALIWEEDSRLIVYLPYEGYPHEERAPRHPVPLWRQASEMLQNLDEVYRFETEYFLKGISAHLEPRWQADLLAMSWCRTRWATELLKYSDEELEVLARRYPRFREYHWDKEESETLWDVLLTIGSECGDAYGEEETADLQQLTRHYGLEFSESVLDSLAKCLEAGLLTEDEERAVQGLVAAVARRWPEPRSFNTGMIRVIWREALTNYVRKHFFDEGRLPTGRHEVPEVGPVDFDRVSEES